MSQDVSAQASFLDRHHFLLRRLHSLSGIVPIGVFLMFHLFTNMQMAFDTFQHEVEWIHSLPALLFLEIFGLWLPIAFHAALGIVYTVSGKSNIRRYRYGDNIRYTLQRVTGIVALVFIFFHVATLRWGWPVLGEYTPFFAHGYGLDAAGEIDKAAALIPLSTASTVIAIQAGFIVAALYVLGVASSVYHFANGLWTAAITWGLTISEQAQRRWGYVCIVLGLALTAFAAIALGYAFTYQPTEQEWASYQQTLEHWVQTGEYPKP